jgi:hypothetical protein
MENVQDLAAPHGLEDLLTNFGDIFEYIHADGSLDARWYSEFLGRLTLPFPLRLSWDKSTSVTQMTCHKRIAPVFAMVFGEIEKRGLQAKIESFGGCFSFRPQRRSTKLSTHAWGIAIDLNTDDNAQGSTGNMDAGLVEIFRSAGFEWGGEWVGSACDPMHFQFCTGY